MAEERKSAVRKRKQIYQMYIFSFEFLHKKIYFFFARSLQAV